MQRSITTSNSDKINIERVSLDPISVIRILRLTQIKSNIKGNAEKQLGKNGANPRWVLHLYNFQLMSLLG